MSLSHGNWKQIFDVFRFWELSFSGIFVKLSKEWHPPEWFVPSHNVSLQKLVWHSHSNLFFSLSLLLLHFFFFYPELSLLTDPSLLLHKPPPSHQSSPSRATTTRSVQAQLRLGLRFFSLSLSLSSLCQIGFSLRHYFSLSSLLPYRYHHEQPPQATMRPVQAQPRSSLRCFSLSFLPL